MTHHRKGQPRRSPSPAETAGSSGGPPRGWWAWLTLVAVVLGGIVGKVGWPWIVETACYAPAAFESTLDRERLRLKDPKESRDAIAALERLPPTSSAARLCGEPRERAYRVADLLANFVSSSAGPGAEVPGKPPRRCTLATGSPPVPEYVSAALLALGRMRLQAADTDTLKLAGLDLRGVQADGVELAGASLHGACLVRASLGHAHLERADLRGAKLDGARLAGAYLAGADLTGATLDSARLEGARLDGDTLTQASLVGATLDTACLREAQLTGADLTGAHLFGTDLTLALLGGARLDGAYVSQAIFTGAYLRGATLGGLRLWSDIRGFQGANVQETEDTPPGFLAFAFKEGALPETVTEREWQALRAQRLAAPRPPGPSRCAR